MKNSLVRNRSEYVRLQGNPGSLDPISAHFRDAVGPLIPTDPISLSHKRNIWINRCAIDGQPFQVLFTTGLCSLASVELYLVLPLEPEPWPIRRFYQHPRIEESFPIELLTEVIQLVDRKGSSVRLEEGAVFLRSKPSRSKLCWDSRDGLVDGLVLIDHVWSQSQCLVPDDSHTEVRLLALVPFSAGEVPGLGIRHGRATLGIETRRRLQWESISLPFNPGILSQRKLEEAFAARDPDLVMQAVRAGADLTRPLIRSHDSFGYYPARTVLIEAMDLEDEHLIQFLVESGAPVPRDTIASLGRWGSRYIVEYLIEHGADIDACSCGMSALQRAKAFKNDTLVTTLRELGAT